MNFEVVSCDICGQLEHCTDDCNLTHMLKNIEDTKTLSHARLTIPEDLVVTELEDGSLTVITNKSITHATQFGPFTSPLRKEKDFETRFWLKKFNSDESFQLLDCSNETFCNWMCLVAPARNEFEWNLVAYQLKDEIYYTSLRNITPNEELRVWYATHYARRMGLNPPWVAAVAENVATCSLDASSGVDVTLTPPLEEPVPPTVTVEQPVETKKRKRGRPKRLRTEEDELEDWKPEISTPPPEEVEEPQPTLPLGRVKRKRKVLFDVKSLLKNKPTDWFSKKLEEGSSSSVEDDDEDDVMEDQKPCVTAWSCQHCDETFGAVSDFASHLRSLEEDPAPSAYTCSKCSRKFQTRDGLRKHGCSFSEAVTTCSVSLEDVLKTKNKFVQMFLVNEQLNRPTGEEVAIETDGTTEPHRPKCKEFEERLREDGDAAWYLKNSDRVEFILETPSLEPCKCEICKVVFPMRANLAKHLERHMHMLNCDLCGKIFRNSRLLKKHVNLNCATKPRRKKSHSVFSCEVCGRMFNSLIKLKRHNVRHEGSHFCNDCGKTYATKVILAEHACSQKDQFAKFVCNVCLKCFTRETYLENHMPIHTGEYFCSICGKWLRSQHSLVNHMRNCSAPAEDSPEVLTCNNCPDTFADLKLYRQHIFNHTHSHQCSRCGARFRNKVSLGFHVCNLEEKFECEHCDGKFTTLVAKQSHVHQEHPYITTPVDETENPSDNMLPPPQAQPEEMPPSPLLKTYGGRKQWMTELHDSKLMCEECGARFASHSSLSLHKKLHGERSFVCELCSKSFYRKDLLQDHMSVHGEPEIPCPTCEKLFKTKKSVDAHLKTHDTAKRYTCGECGKTFNQKGQLVKHNSIAHNPNSDKFFCGVCGRSFSSREYLSTHMLEHTQGRPHSCEICGKTFVKESLLKIHARGVHGDTSYVCPYCKRPLKSKHSMNRHLKSRHPALRDEWEESGFVDTLRTLTSQAEYELQTEQATASIATDGIETLNLSSKEEEENVYTVNSVEELQKALRASSAGETIAISLNRELEEVLMNENVVFQPDGTEENMEPGSDCLNTSSARIIELPTDEDLIVNEASDQELRHFQLQIAGEVELGNGLKPLLIQNSDKHEFTSGSDTILLENGSRIVENGSDEDNNQVLYYVLTEDDIVQE